MLNPDATNPSNRARRAACAGRRAAVTIVGLALGLTACQPAMNWQFYAYNPQSPPFDPGDRLTFIYLRSWLDPACTQFEDQVLSSTEVTTATRPMVCGTIDVGDGVGRTWGITEAPAFVILDPAGKVLAKGQGDLTKQDVLSAVEEARKLHESDARGAAAGRR